MLVDHSRPPPLTYYFSIGTPLSANEFLFADRLSANKKLFADSGVPIEKKHVKGGGLLYGGYL